MTMKTLIMAISIALLGVNYQSVAVADSTVTNLKAKTPQQVAPKLLKQINEILDYNSSLLTDTPKYKYSFKENNRATLLTQNTITRKQALNSSNVYYNNSKIKILNAKETINKKVITVIIDAHEILYLDNHNYDLSAPATSETITQYEFKFENDGNAYNLISIKELDPFDKPKTEQTKNNLKSIDILPTSEYGTSPSAKVQIEENKNDKVNTKYTTNSTGYLNKSRIAAYAYKYWSSYNSSYRRFSSDCTNFVSQAMSYGGWPQISGFYRNNSVWWYNWANQSYTWAGAHNWFDFTKTKNRGYIARYFSDLTVGDVLQADWDRNGSIDHTMIITKKDSYGNIYLTYHSTDTKDKPIKDLLTKYPSAAYYGWRLYTSYTY